MVRRCPPVIPGTYNGRVTINDHLAPDGTVIRVLVDGLEWACALALGGRFVVDVPERLPIEPPCFEGGTVVFRSGGLTARQRPAWRSGLHDVDLTLRGSMEELEISSETPRAAGLPVGGRPQPKRTRSEPMTVHPIFRNREFALDEALCFVLMPFEPELAPVYEDHIKAAAETQGLTCVRADDLFSPGEIMEQIWEQMNRAALIVADLTGRNPNVFYELGVAHTLGKPVILIAQSEDDVPFDLRHLRFIRYQATLRGCRQLERSLRSAIRSALVA